MNVKAELRKKIWAIDFALYELVLFLDTHPDSAKASELMRLYRERRSELVSQYEREYGPLAETAATTPLDGSWKWIDGPWPWENNFASGNSTEE